MCISYVIRSLHVDYHIRFPLHPQNTFRVIHQARFLRIFIEKFEVVRQQRLKPLQLPSRQGQLAALRPNLCLLPLGMLLLTNFY